jgi:hypothetical protein
MAIWRMVDRLASGLLRALWPGNSRPVVPTNWVGAKIFLDEKTYNLIYIIPVKVLFVRPETCDFEVVRQTKALSFTIEEEPPCFM